MKSVDDGAADDDGVSIGRSSGRLLRARDAESKGNRQAREALGSSDELFGATLYLVLRAGHAYEQSTNWHTYQPEMITGG